MRLRTLLLATAAALAGAVAGAASAQSVAGAPVRETLDANGVDLLRGVFVARQTVMSIGGNQGLTYDRIYRGASTTDSITGYFENAGNTFVVGFGDRWDRFTKSGSTFMPTERRGASLAQSGTSYVYTTRDGTTVRFDQYRTERNGTLTFLYKYLVAAVVDPSGGRLDYAYDEATFCPNDADACTVGRQYVQRLRSVTNAFNYQLLPEYGLATLSNSGDLNGWMIRTNLRAINLACDSTTDSSCPSTSSGPSTSSPNAVTATYTTSNGVTGIRRPGSSSNDVAIAYNGARVSSVADHKGATIYAYSDSADGSKRTVTVTDALGHATVYVFDIARERLLSVTDPKNRTTSYLYDSDGRLTRVTAPEGNYVEYTLDARGNVTATRWVAKPGSGLADIRTAATYPCTSAVTCNRPATTTDARGNVTNYTYDASHGGVLTVTLPAPVAGAVRPQTRYGYTTLQAQLRNANGVLVGNGKSVVLPTSISQCRSTAICTGSADETRVITSYDPAKNLLPTSITTMAGNSSIVATNAMSYDAIGNMVGIDGPLDGDGVNGSVDAAGTGDTIVFRYDGKRRRTGVIAPDPDGAGPLRRRAQRVTYGTRELATRVEQGVVTGNGPTAWTGFVTAQQLDVSYDADGQVTRQILSANGTKYGVTDTSYNVVGLTSCVAQRMNTATWGTVTGACTAQATGAAGPDRIVKTAYTEADEVLKVTSASGTSVQSDDAALTYRNNGQVATMTDANANRTTYEYDGHDRASITRFPATAIGSNASSATDYEQASYDLAGNLTSHRLRDGQVIGYGYDALDRVISKNLPGSEPDVGYAYDLLGHMTGASQSGSALTMTWDALGRQVGETGPLRTVSYGYDVAGRRTRVGWPDGFHVRYGYQANTADVVSIVENGDTSPYTLATFGYDDLGRRTGVARGNGTSTVYGYDAAARLSAVTQQLAGTAWDLAIGLGYNAASQIASTTRSNDAYAWQGLYNVARGHAVNGLNQVVAGDGGPFAYDLRGNLVGAGGRTFGYSSENLMVSAPGVTLAYDPLLRLRQTSGAATRRFLYDGDAIVAEYDAGGALIQRYVRGPGEDEPLVAYAGSAVGSRRWLHADERGSVLASSDAGGGAGVVQSYDEYGVPAATNAERFGYTGQAWLPEAGLWYYKARMYEPRLGRFMQTDPIGHAGGANLYAYVGNDPVNYVDPTGLQPACANVTSGEVCVPGSRMPGGARGGASIGSGNGPHRDPHEADLGAEVLVSCDAACRARKLGEQQSVVEDITEDIVVVARRVQRSLTQAANRIEGALNVPFIVLQNLSISPACAASEGAACTLAEQLAIERARGSNARRIMQGQINDPRYPESVWGKFQYVHKRLWGGSITVHFWRNLQTGTEEGFKIKR